MGLNWQFNGLLLSFWWGKGDIWWEVFVKMGNVIFPLVPVGFCISVAKSFSKAGSPIQWWTTKQLCEAPLFNSYCIDDSSSVLCDNNGCATNLSISRCTQANIVDLNDH